MIRYIYLSNHAISNVSLERHTTANRSKYGETTNMHASNLFNNQEKTEITEMETTVAVPQTAIYQIN